MYEKLMKYKISYKNHELSALQNTVSTKHLLKNTENAQLNKQSKFVSTIW